MANYIVKEHNGSDGADSRTKSTFAVWVKRSRTGVAEQIWSWGENNSSDARLKFQSSDILRLHSDGTGSPIETTRKFRDCNGWYHFVVTFDGSNGTEAHRRRIWINGIEWVHGASTSAFSASVAGHNSTQDLYIGDNARMQQNAGNAEPFVGYMSHFHYCDGYAYTAADFGEFDSTTGEWKAITAPSVNYGTHGIFLKMEDSANMDLDSSPNASTQLSTTGTILPSLDCPANVFATFNDMIYNQVTLTNANTTAAAGGWMGIPSTIGLSKGKWYWEYKNTVQTNWGQNGIMSSKPNGGYDSIYSTYVGNCSGGLALNSGNGDFYHDGSSGAYGTSAWFPGMVAGDIISVALDVDASKIWFGKNGSWGNSSDPAAGTNGIDFSGDADFTSYKPYFPCFSGNAVTCDYNFGNGYFGTTAISSEGTNASGIGKFEYDVPTGFKAICTKGLNS